MDFRDNGIVCLAKDFFGYSVSKGLDVGKLNLAGNSLWEQLGQDTEGDTFADYGNLTELNLAYNQIKTLPKKIFKNIPRLRVLNLSGNSLQLIEFDQSHFNRLEMLDLSSNLLIQLDADTRGVLMNLFTTCVNLSLNVFGNPLQCSCESLGFLKWLKLNKNRVAYYENTTCLFDNILHNFTGMDDLVNRLDFDCSKPLAMIVTGSLFGITVLGIFLSVFLYRHRWDIRYFLLKLSQKGKVYQKLVDLSKDYVYDAFVAYDKNDRNWVVKELIPNLETSGEQQGDENPDAIREPMRLCIHERDFQLGNWIEENIVTAIEQSRQIILVVSNHFLESKWCRFELEVARMQSLERGRNLIVPILLEDVSLENMPASLQFIVRKHTYIEWKGNEELRGEFWRRLTDVLSNMENNVFRCECGRTTYDSQ